MSKPHSKSSTDTSSDKSVSSLEPPSIGWSPRKRAIVSLLVSFHLFAVIAAPMANPQPSSELFGRISRILQPYLQALFLNHGYRFFAPEPGPSHIIKYEIFNTEQPILHEIPDATGLFPDRNGHWPRQLYHRWFMLSETVFAVSSEIPTDTELEATRKQFAEEIQQLRAQGDIKKAAWAEAQLQQSEVQLQIARDQQKRLLDAIGRHLLQQHDGKRVKLTLCQRLIPPRIDIGFGKKLDDQEYLVVLGDTSIDGIWASENPDEGPNVSGNDTPANVPVNSPGSGKLEQISQ